MSSKKTKGKPLFVRIMAILLAAIMVIGVGFYIFMLIGGNQRIPEDIEKTNPASNAGFSAYKKRPETELQPLKVFDALQEPFYVGRNPIS